MKWFEIPSEVVPKLRELQQKNAHEAIVQNEDAVVMFYGMGDPMYLTFDGRVIIYEFFVVENGPREAKTLAEAAMAVVVGAKIRKFPELLSLLPERPDDAFDCERCETSGWIKLFKSVPPFVCEDCGGLGWQLPASENIIE
jgi:hypothetical protein